MSTDKKPHLISLVVPFFNEADVIDDFVNAMNQLINSLPNFNLEIVCVDDGSEDTTLKYLLAVVETNSHFRVIELTRNFGKEAALTAGIDAALGDAVIPLDADLQDPPTLIPKLIEAWQQGAEVVQARRSDRSSDSFLKRKTAEFFYKFHNQLSETKIPSNVGDFRLMDRCVVDALKMLPERQRFMKGLFAWLGFKTVTIDYVRESRIAGTSKFSGWKLWNFALEGFTSFSIAPLKIWTYIGGVGAIFTFLYATFIIIKTLVYGIDIPGYASLLVVVLFLGSLQLISVGILGEYLGRIYMESKQRPIYLIRKQYGDKQ